MRLFYSVKFSCAFFQPHSTPNPVYTTNSRDLLKFYLKFNFKMENPMEIFRIILARFSAEPHHFIKSIRNVLQQVTRDHWISETFFTWSCCFDRKTWPILMSLVQNWRLRIVSSINYIFYSVVARATKLEVNFIEQLQENRFETVQKLR